MKQLMGIFLLCLFGTLTAFANNDQCYGLYFTNDTTNNNVQIIYVSVFEHDQIFIPAHHTKAANLCIASGGALGVKWLVQTDDKLVQISCPDVALPNELDGEKYSYTLNNIDNKHYSCVLESVIK